MGLQAVKLDHMSFTAREWSSALLLLLCAAAGLEFKGKDAVVTTKLTLSLAEASAASFKECMERRMLDLPAVVFRLDEEAPPIGMRSSKTSEARLSVLRSKKAKRFHLDEAIVCGIENYLGC